GGAALYHGVGRLDPAVGASGAIFGLMGALVAATYRQRHTPAGRAVFSQLSLLLAINLALPLIVPNIAWEAHVG
ncbi:MAG: rhomboid family intramembrane serine protease, partial [Actinobacteria bacterium]|nr:rhomboid family intramembrane serine protease [Actinomycetota bacterium]NIS32905.1 rhomboid family intramembrane serine protease [Actinomycetota bacterium]NIT96534.1 rhomboid family intramembrane serine protease [Actinomycetota bacterium]NIU20228.1 rhomboid family intramembrane serine protease [Actinomycetota bacterium]NIU67868.1 rhomboid family intramembrane serine protease [Actinomycetota bacterium]